MVASRKERYTEPILLENIIKKGKSCAYFLCEPNSYGDMDFLYILLFFEDKVYQVNLEHDFDSDGYSISDVETNLETALREVKREDQMITCLGSYKSDLDSDRIAYRGLDLFSVYDELKSRECPEAYVDKILNAAAVEFNENIRQPLFRLAYLWVTNNIGYDSFPLDEFLNYLQDHLITETGYRGMQVEVLDEEHWQESIAQQDERFENWWNSI